MAKYLGNELLLKIEEPADSGTYNTIGATTEHSITFGNESTDVSDKDTQRWVSLLAAGARNVAISFSGWISDDTYYALFQGYSDTDTIVRYQLVWGNSELIIGSFHVDSTEKTGEKTGAQGFSATISSTDEIMQGILPTDFLTDEAADLLLDEDNQYLQGAPI